MQAMRLIRNLRTRIKNLLFLVLLAFGACSDERAGEPLFVDSEKQLNVLGFDSGETSSTPHLSVGSLGPVLSWVRSADGISSLYFSVFNGAVWLPETLVSSGDNWFNNWADFPSVVPINGDLWAAHWLVESADQYYAYDVFVSVSQDAGKTWQAPRKIHSDGTASEHGFVSLFDDAGEVAAVWLDGRNTVKKNASKAKSGMMLRSARISVEGEISRSLVVDSFTCDCCGTDVVNTSQGPMVVYRDRTENETRDIAAAHLSEAGWSGPLPVGADNWIIEGCPVNGPAIDAHAEQVIVAWYTRAQDRSRVNIAWSDNGGLKFPDILEIAGSGTRGRVDVALLGKDRAAVSWLEVRPGDDEASLMLRYVNRRESALLAGTDGAVAIEITRLENSRSAGFPQMVSHAGKLFFAWTDSVNKRVVAATF